MRRRNNWLYAAIAALIVLVTGSAYSYSSNYESTPINPDLTIHYIDVGQGDSELIQLPNGKTMLIDAGDNGSEQTLLAYLKQQQVDTIDYLIGTHPHADHIGGLPEVLETFTVKNVYMPRASHTSNTFKKLLETIARQGLTIHTAKSGVTIFDENGLKAEFLAPHSDSYKNLNNYSAVLKLTYKNTSYLFMGDAETLVENELLSANDVLQADVLKVGHHGSNTSSGTRFLEAVEPKYAVISCGRGNEYDHPHDEALKRIKKTGAKVFRTDKMGTITVESDGEQYKITKQGV